MIADFKCLSELDKTILTESRDARKMKRLIAFVAVIEPMLGMQFFFTNLAVKLIWMVSERGRRQGKAMYFPSVRDYRG